MASKSNRKLLTKLLKSSDVRREHRDLLATDRTALRFVQGVCEHEDPTDVLLQLNRQDPHLVKTIFARGSSNSSFVDLVTMPFLGWLGKDALSVGTCGKRQQSICNELARAPGLMEGLLEAQTRGTISDEMTLLWFLERLILDDGADGILRSGCRQPSTLRNPWLRAEGYGQPCRLPPRGVRGVPSF